MVVINVTCYTWGGLGVKLAELVDNDWIYGTIHKFYCKKVLLFRLKVRPTSNQPGNGLVEFWNSATEFGAPGWKELIENLKNQIGNITIAKFFNAKIVDQMTNVNPQTNDVRIKILLLFEIARRVEDPPYVSRKETQEAIIKVFRAGRTHKNTNLYINDLIKLFRDINTRSFEVTKEIRQKVYNRIITSKPGVRPSIQVNRSRRHFRTSGSQENSLRRSINGPLCGEDESSYILTDSEEEQEEQEEQS